MPRGRKQKAVVYYGPKGNIVKHGYHYNHRKNPKEKLMLKKYDPVTRQRVELKVKDERHST